MFIEDLSANGTWINYPDAKLTKHQRRILHSGDEILLVDPSRNSGKKCEDCNFTFIDKVRGVWLVVWRGVVRCGVVR